MIDCQEERPGISRRRGLHKMLTLCKKLIKKKHRITPYWASFLWSWLTKITTSMGVAAERLKPLTASASQP